MKWITKDYTIHQVWSGIWKAYQIYYLFGFVIVYVHEYKPQFRNIKTAMNYVNTLKEKDAKNNS